MLRKAIYATVAGWPGEYLTAGYGLGSGLLAIATFCGGSWKWAFFGLGAVVVLAMIVLSIVRARAEESVRDEFRRERAQLLRNDLSPLIMLLSDALGQKDEIERGELAAQVRKGVVVAAAALVAPATRDVRANLFKKNSRAKKMTLDRGCFHGRGEKSSRVFKPGDETWEATMTNDYRLVTKVRDHKYGCYLTMPVSSGDDPSEVHGVLTVDAPGEEDLSLEDLPVLELLARIAAAAYRV